jgi:2-aminoethylphosphonate-pyruvate transaminase
VLITGSGTAALETAVTSRLSPTGRLVVVANGTYGDAHRRAMAAAARLPHSIVAGEWPAPPDLAAAGSGGAPRATSRPSPSSITRRRRVS